MIQQISITHSITHRLVVYIYIILIIIVLFNCYEYDHNPNL